MSVNDQLELVVIEEVDYDGLSVQCHSCMKDIPYGNEAWRAGFGNVECKDCVERARENAENQKGAPSWVDL